MSKLEGRIEKLESKRGYTLTQEQKDAVARAMLLRMPGAPVVSDEEHLRQVYEFIREDQRKMGWL